MGTWPHGIGHRATRGCLGRPAPTRGRRRPSECPDVRQASRSTRARHGDRGLPQWHLLERRAALARIFRRHLYLTIVLFVVALAASLLAGRSVGSLIVGAALATCLFALVAVIASAAVRQEAIDAIARGDGRVIARRAPAQLSGLTSKRNRRALANTLALCLQPAPRSETTSCPRQGPGAGRTRTSRFSSPRSSQTPTRSGGRDRCRTGHQLITAAGSPLYCGTVEELRHRLHRIRHLLATDDPIPGGQAGQVAPGRTNRRHNGAVRPSGGAYRSSDIRLSR